jgi:hypothetical protein
MLAMDIVDTLRHQRAQVEAELDEDRREQQLIARIQSIYESQGMDVPPGVIAEGVKALVEDRFTYDPPKRSIAVRFAEVYVERGKWALRLLVVTLVAAAAFAAFAIPAHLKREGLIDDFRLSITILERRADDLERLSTQLRGRVAGAPVPKESAAAAEILADAKRSLNESKNNLDRVQSALDPGPDPDTYPDDRERLDGVLSDYGELLDRVNTDLGGVAGKLESLDSLKDIGAQAKAALVRLAGIPVPGDERRDLEASQAAILASVAAGKVSEAWTGLRGLKIRVAGLVRSHNERQGRIKELNRLSSRLRGVALDSATKSELETLTSSVRQAIDTNDDAVASRDLTRLAGLVALLDHSYELRIATGRGKRSGIFRNTPGRKRNYYIIVEAISSSGRKLRLRIKNEENNRVSRVSIFGVRVPKKVYEGVKADKTDNGIIDRRLFGVKRRGARKIDYRFPVSGGMITRW